MINSTRYKIPKKHQVAIKEVYQDEDGIWCTLNSGYVWGIDENSICNAENYKQLLEELKEIKKQ